MLNASLILRKRNSAKLQTLISLLCKYLAGNIIQLLVVPVPLTTFYISSVEVSTMMLSDCLA